MKTMVKNNNTYAPYRVHFILAVVIYLCMQFVVASAQESQTKTPSNTDAPSLETAEDFMSKVADTYATFQDFQTDVEILQGNKTSTGVLFSKANNKVRINFISPKDQVLVSNGEDFYIYVPSQNISLYQRRKADTSTGSFVTRKGLDQLRNRYVASYDDKPYFVPMQNPSGGASRQVMKIRMKWKSTAQSFRELLLYIGKDFIIYRVDAITYNRQNVQFTFSNIKINKGIPDARFDYTPPPTANVVEDFLFEGTAKQ